jgi:hypothetical protein
VIAGVVPGKHTTRKGWLTKDFHYPQSPYTSDINEPIWKTQHGETMSLRQMAMKVAWYFRRSIRRYSDPFSFRLLFAVLNGRAPSLLELIDRPTAYEDVGNLCRWGMVIHELKNYEAELGLMRPAHDAWRTPPIDQYVVDREAARRSYLTELETVSAVKAKDPKSISLLPEPLPRPIPRRRTDTQGTLVPPRPADFIDRRGTALMPKPRPRERRRKNERRRANAYAIPFPDRRLTRSAYEQVFLKLVSGGKLRVGNDIYRPVGMKGWYHAIFRRDSDGTEKLMSIDQLLTKMNDWI